MRGKNQKVVCSTSPIWIALMFLRRGTPFQPLSSTAASSRGSADAGPLDPAATSPSGFKPGKGKANVPNPIPLEAWTLGCRLSQSEAKHEPVAWVSLEHISRQSTYVLKVTRSRYEKRGVELSISLDRDVDQIEYTDPDSTWKEDSVAVIKLHATRACKHSSKGPQCHFNPGTKLAQSFITFKFMVQHSSFIDGEDYRTLVDILKIQIKDHSVQKGSKAPAAAWQVSEAAAQLFVEGPRQRQTRSNTSLKRQSPLSAGPANDDSTAVMASEHSSTSAPPSRTYGIERRTTRQSARNARTSPSPISDPDELLLVYPPTGTGAVNITRGDVKRLDDGQYLNDTLIEFGLKLWLDDLRKSDPETAEQVHVFNSFFYKKLSGKKEFAEAYPSVRKWSSKVDIFSKKYIIVPINENFHWYLAIIENPANMLHPPPPEARHTPQTRKRKRESAGAGAEELVSEDKDPPAGDSTETPTETSKQASEQPEPSTPPDPVPDAMAVDGDSEGDRQEVDSLLGEMTQTQLSVSGPARSPSVELNIGELQYPGSEDPMDVDPVPAPEPGDGRKSPLPKAIVVDDDADMDAQDKAPESMEGDSKPDSKEDEAMSHEEEDAAEPAPSTNEQAQDLNAYVYTFDSLGSRHGAAANKLGKYLRFEAEDKKGLKIEDTRLAVWKNAKSPMQTNFCDCGLFVLAFVEAFMKDPTRAGEVIRQSKAEWYLGRREDFREPFRKRTLEMSDQWKKERAAKEEVKAPAQEEPKEDGTSDKEKEESAKEAEEKPKSKQPETTVIEDSDDDEVIISEVRPPPKASRGGKKSNTNSGKAARLRG
ncbi:hypothetical protein LXA43DRAFT_939951 [Ganoderma leucocontextum]|nr:hypothetical protein LXA43DRAFT_939951 [Ganoderma leucocontextum]